MKFIKFSFHPHIYLIKIIGVAIILPLTMAFYPSIGYGDDSVLFPQLKSPAAQNIGGNWLVKLSNKEDKVIHTHHIVIAPPNLNFCEPVDIDICNYRIIDSPSKEWETYYYGAGNTFARGHSISNSYSLKFKHAYGIVGHWGAESKINFSRDKGVGQWEYGDDKGREVWTRLRPKINKINFSAVYDKENKPISSVPPGTPGKVTGTYEKKWWGPENHFPHTRPFFYVNIYGENLWGYHIFDVKAGQGLSTSGSCTGIHDKNSKNFTGHTGLRCTVDIKPGTFRGRKILRLDNIEIPFDFDITGLAVAKNTPEPENKKEGSMELNIIEPQNLRASTSSNTYYPIDPKSAVVFELKNTGDKPLEDLQLLFNLNHGSIKSFTGDGKSCARNRETKKGSCGFVNIDPGQSKKIGLMLHVTGLNLKRENSFRDKLKIEAIAKASGLKDKNENIEIVFEECASPYKEKLTQNRMGALGRYHKGTFAAIHKNDDYPTERTYEHKKTKSSRINESNALVLEMLANGGNDAYLANGAAKIGEKGIRDLFFDHIKTMPDKVKGGMTCNLTSDPAVKAIQRAKEFKLRAKEISIRAERDRREAKRWSKAIHDTLKDVGTETGATLKQGQNSSEGAKAMERKVEMFSFSQGMQGLSNYFRVGQVQSAALGRTLGFLSLAISAKQIVESTWDSITLARISLFEVFQGLAAIETAAHMQVLNDRYKAIDKANDAMIKELEDIYKSKCACKVPFE